MLHTFTHKQLMYVHDPYNLMCDQNKQQISKASKKKKENNMSSIAIITTKENERKKTEWREKKTSLSNRNNEMKWNEMNRSTAYVYICYCCKYAVSNVIKLILISINRLFTIKYIVLHDNYNIQPLERYTHDSKTKTKKNNRNN